MLMTCRHMAQLRDVYLDGELSPSLTAEVHAHLLQCPECQNQFEMFRACGEVIAKDRCDHLLDSGFAGRVLASLPKTSPLAARSSLKTRRDTRQRSWRLFISSGVPAAAAILFFSVLVWPVGEEPANPAGLVRGVSVEATEATGVQQVAESTLDAVAEAQSAARSLDQILRISVDGARQGVDGGAETAAAPKLTFTEIFLDPFRDFLQPIEEPSEATSQEKEDLVRF